MGPASGSASFFWYQLRHTGCSYRYASSSWLAVAAWIAGYLNQRKLELVSDVISVTVAAHRFTLVVNGLEAVYDATEDFSCLFGVISG